LKTVKIFEIQLKLQSWLDAGTSAAFASVRWWTEDSIYYSWTGKSGTSGAVLGNIFLGQFLKQGYVGVKKVLKLSSTKLGTVVVHYMYDVRLFLL